MRLIDAEALLEECFGSVWFGARGNGKTVIAMAKGIAKGILEIEIQKAPTVEAKPIIHAHWEEQNDGTHFCSRCGNDATYTYEGKELVGFLCPFCGAQMDELVSNTDELNSSVKIPVISMEDVPKIMEEKE